MKVNYEIVGFLKQVDVYLLSLWSLQNSLKEPSNTNSSEQIKLMSTKNRAKRKRKEVNYGQSDSDEDYQQDGEETSSSSSSTKSSKKAETKSPAEFFAANQKQYEAELVRSGRSPQQAKVDYQNIAKFLMGMKYLRCTSSAGSGQFEFSLRGEFK